MIAAARPTPVCPSVWQMDRWSRWWAARGAPESSSSKVTPPDFIGRFGRLYREIIYLSSFCHLPFKFLLPFFYLFVPLFLHFFHLFFIFFPLFVIIFEIYHSPSIHLSSTFHAPLSHLSFISFISSVLLSVSNYVRGKSLPSIFTFKKDLVVNWLAGAKVTDFYGRSVYREYFQVNHQFSFFLVLVFSL